MMLNQPEFIVFCGAMFSGKSTSLMSALERYRHQGKTIITFKPALDDRYDSDSIVTHFGWKMPAVSVHSSEEMLQHLANFEGNIDVVAVDEAFMIKNVSDALVFLYRSGVNVVVSSLDLSHNGTPFTEIKNILPWATRVVKCAAVCTVCGADAMYTHKKVLTDEEIEIGGSELYEPRCWNHHVIINRGT